MEGIADCFYDQKVCSSIVKSHRDNIVLRATNAKKKSGTLSQTVTVWAEHFFAELPLPAP